MESNPFAADGGIEDPFDNPHVLANEFVESDSAQPYVGDFYEENPNPYESAGDSSSGNSGKSSKKGKGGLLAVGQSSYGGPSDAKGDSSAEVDLARREAKLKAREEALLEREAQARSANAMEGGRVENNWPSTCYPIAYHNIAAEIPASHRSFMRQMYGLCLWTWLCLMFNWFAIIVVVLVPSDVPSTDAPKSNEAFFSSAYLVLGVIGSWKLWYRAIYNAAKRSSSSRWMFFFVNFFMHTVFSIIMAVGIPGTAGVGLWFVIEMISEKYKTATIMGVVGLCMWTVNALGSLFFFRKAHRLFKGGGGASQAKKDLTKAMLEQSIESGRV